MVTAAVLYQEDGYNTSGRRLMGRQAASEGFLKAISSDATDEPLYCYTPTQQSFQNFCQRVQPWLPPTRPLRWVPEEQPEGLSEPGVLYRPDPVLSQLAWQRRYRNERSYSLCGVTHTLASKETMAAMGDLLIAPVQPWDAVVCTSQTVKTTLEKALGEWADYLAQRIGSRPQIPLQLPVIPLGVDCDVFPAGAIAQTARQHLRQQLGIGAADLVVLFVGRLIFHAKAHPVPMYLAVERAAQQVKQKVHLVQAGWFEDNRQEAEFKGAAAQFCPTANHLFVDGRQPQVRQMIWAIADVFISLADNIQETFGLTPVEAMAAGLPVIVADWDGYQETVRHEVDGFRIPTLLPPPGCGLDFAARYQSDRLNYSTFVGHISLLTAIDVGACTAALIRLLTTPELRQKMGEHGRQRARAVYDWKVVFQAYKALWQELGDRRQHAIGLAPLTPGRLPHPLCDDPFRQLDHYPTRSLQAGDRLILGEMAAPDQLQTLRANWMVSFGADWRISEAGINALLESIAQAGSVTVAEVLHQFGQSVGQSDIVAQVYLCRTLVYLIKFDVLRLV
ncbi:MAG TPA: glycosyltransferase family 4 protein [Synechococcales cyanobacterium M55_K2018_004]|nr:glycosyltransferase family 4 protein [Synechococcales cyanobacterium M55_K2018_004]